MNWSNREMEGTKDRSLHRHQDRAQRCNEKELGMMEAEEKIKARAIDARAILRLPTWQRCTDQFHTPTIRNSEHHHDNLDN